MENILPTLPLKTLPETDVAGTVISIKVVNPRMHEHLENTDGSCYKFYLMEQLSETQFLASWGRIEKYPRPQGTKVYPMADFYTMLAKKFKKGYYRI